MEQPSNHGDNLPVAPSAIKPAGQTWTATGQQDFVTPHELTVEEIAEIVAGYDAATRRAIEAGFDGVELHGASRYLPEQFLSWGSNKREDDYGGSIKNRMRFVLEVLAAMVKEAGGDRVGIKVSPEMDYNDITDENPQALYWELVGGLKQFNLAYLHVALFGTPVDYHALLKPLFNGAYLMGGGLDTAKARTAIEKGRADATVFGSAFLANPDLAVRLRTGAPLNTPDRDTFFSAGAKGYIDYPALETADAAQGKSPESRHPRLTANGRRLQPLIAHRGKKHGS